MIQSFKEFLVWELMSKDTIDFKTCYVDIAEDLIAGLLLSQIIYWHLPSKQTGKTKLRVKRNGKLWIAKKREEWYDEIRISEKQYDRAAKILVEKGLIIIAEKKWKFIGVPTIHISLDNESLINKMNEYLKDNKITSFPDSGIHQIPHESLIPKSLNTEKFKETWLEWCTFRKEKRSKLTITTARRQLNKLSGYDIDFAIKVLDRSMDNGWLGIFPESTTKTQITTDKGINKEGY